MILTTHSPIALAQLRTTHLRVVRRTDGVVTVQTPSDSAQGNLINHAEAFLSRKVIVCEGRTELGLVVGLDEGWATAHERFASAGIALTDAGGVSKVAGVALDFARLGYPVAVLADSDKPLTRPVQELEDAGVRVLQWAEAVATEQRLFADLPWSAVCELGRLASDHNFPVTDQVASQLKVSPSVVGRSDTWPGKLDQHEMRLALGFAAKSGAWFKNVRLGIELGKIVAGAMGSIAGTDLSEKTLALRKWVFDDI